MILTYKNAYDLERVKGAMASSYRYIYFNSHVSKAYD